MKLLGESMLLRVFSSRRRPELSRIRANPSQASNPNQASPKWGFPKDRGIYLFGGPQTIALGVYIGVSPFKKGHYQMPPTFEAPRLSSRKMGSFALQVRPQGSRADPGFRRIWILLAMSRLVGYEGMGQAIRDLVTRTPQH